MVSDMKKETNDYQNYDYLSITLQTEKTDEMIDVYHKFGWEVVSKLKNRDYENLYYITLKRPHFIDNKDELQYLQVRMEESVNKLAIEKSRKNLKSILFGSLLGLLTVFLFVISIFGIVNKYDTFSFIASIVLCTITPILSPFIAVKCYRMAKKENAFFNDFYINTNQEIDEIVNRATLLLGGTK